MSALKAVFDPKGLLCAGNMFVWFQHHPTKKTLYLQSQEWLLYYCVI